MTDSSCLLQSGILVRHVTDLSHVLISETTSPRSMTEEVFVIISQCCGAINHIPRDKCIWKCSYVTRGARLGIYVMHQACGSCRKREATYQGARRKSLCVTIHGSIVPYTILKQFTSAFRHLYNVFRSNLVYFNTS